MEWDDNEAGNKRNLIFYQNLPIGFLTINYETVISILD